MKDWIVNAGFYGWIMIYTILYGCLYRKESRFQFFLVELLESI